MVGKETVRSRNELPPSPLGRSLAWARQTAVLVDGTTVLVTLSGRGDKDAAQIAERLTGERIS